MRRASLLLMLLVTIMLAGCLSEPPVYTEPAEIISISAGQDFVVALDANPTTGHSWQESHDATMLKLVEETFELGESAREGLIGAGGVTKFRFKAIGKGMTKIIMVYKRPWEQEVVEQEAFAVDIK